MIILCVLLFVIGTEVWKQSKLVSGLLIVAGMFMIALISDNYRYDQYKTLPTKIEQEVRIITYKSINGYKIPIDTIEFKTKY